MPPVIPSRTSSKYRAVAALSAAMIVDLLSVALGPLGFGFVDELLDLFAMVLTSWLIGFHPLLLPTFVVEFIPLIDMLPTWTACVATVIWIRRRRS